MHELFEKMSFLLHGGILDMLADQMSKTSPQAVILEPRGEDLSVLEAIGITPPNLIISGERYSLEQTFYGTPSLSMTPLNLSLMNNKWGWGIPLKGKEWTFYFLFSHRPSQQFLNNLPAIEGLIKLWQDFNGREAMEQRLSRLAYMILATKNTLSSIFEPMPLDYFAAFLSDVIRESLFPADLAIIHDDGEKLTSLEGDIFNLPKRDANLFTRLFTPSPIPIDSDHAEIFGEERYSRLAHKWSVLLPIPSMKQKLYCLLKWNHSLEKEDLNFLELLGNVASKALSISCLHEERDAALKELSEQAYALQALHQATLQLMEQPDIHHLCKAILDMFCEISRSRQGLLMLWDMEEQSYTFRGIYCHGKIKTPTRSIKLPFFSMDKGSMPSSFSLEMARSYFHYLKVPALLNFPEIIGAQWVIPLIHKKTKLLGFVALWEKEEGNESVHISLFETLGQTASAAICCFYNKSFPF